MYDRIISKIASVTELEKGFEEEVLALQTDADERLKKFLEELVNTQSKARAAYRRKLGELEAARSASAGNVPDHIFKGVLNSLTNYDEVLRHNSRLLDIFLMDARTPRSSL